MLTKISACLSLSVAVAAIAYYRASRPEPLPAISTGKIVVRSTKTIAPISPYIYGVSVEWIDGGNFLLDSKTGRLRPDMIEPLKALRIPVWRFPGGILSDYYHWKDGVGVTASRPKRLNPMDNKEHENSFGTDEFIRLCKELGSEPLVTANAGTGTLEELLEWQRYFSTKALPVKFWEIGNEIYLAENKARATIPGNDRRIFKTSAQYSSDFSKWAKALREQDSRVLVGAIAGTGNTSNENKNWLSDLLAGGPGPIDFIALHNAFAPLILGSYDFKDKKRLTDAYAAMFVRGAFTAEDIRYVKSVLVNGGRQPCRIAVTEHFPLFGAGGGRSQIFAILDQSKTLAAALFTASLFHEFMREGVWMANYNVATSKWFGALLTDTDGGIVLTPTYHVYDLYRNQFGSTLVEVAVESPIFNGKAVGTVPARRSVAYLDAVGSRDSSGGVYLAVINRNLTQSLDATISVEGGRAGEASVKTLGGGSPAAINGPALGSTVEPNAGICVQSSSVRYKPGLLYSFPPSSITVFKWRASV